MSAKPSVSLVAPAAVLGVCLAIGLILLGYFLAAAVMEAHRGDRTVTVRGQATQEISATRATWQLSFLAQAPDLAALGEKLDAGAAEVRSFLLSAGFSENDITVQPVTVEAASATGQSAAWLGRGAIFLETTAADKVAAAWALTPSLLGAGVTLTSPVAGPEFFFEPPETTVAAVWQAADQAAHRAALRFGDHTGQAIGGLRRAEQLPLEILPQDAPLSPRRLLQATTSAEYFLR